MLKGFGLVTILALAMACGGGDTSTEGASTPAPGGAPAAPPTDLITADQVKLGEIDPGMVAKGKELYDVKCQACHSTGTNRVVGPGWKNLLDQRKPEWIMNMIVHTDAMLETDPEAQAMLEECLVRMPNQNLSVDDARNVLEFIRSL
jgi:mono/diheme cytochrome c family protein